ncbi:DUF5682 family protein [Accumulibacter sp.]|uniref:DUF5682 family protein n=1 Tax=Accumulibacter sp. TaxID=2053492 RepID=UPI002C2E1978|nr:DUF5682 family protein [Accumulibacter sp.]HNC20576.1 DUF5682 family protein [Accumulibacter sp.]
MAAPHLFGIRHHGPGCARSLVRAFDALRPDCILIEGPPESEGLLPAVLAEGMQPPVALLSYCPDEPQLAVYHPFAEFSPEWQAIRWAVLHAVPVRFMDLPMANGLALQKARRQADEASPEPAHAEAPAAQDHRQDATSEEAGAPANPAASDDDRAGDPLNWLAHAAGYADGESWWNHMVEERGDGEQLFAAVAEAMTALRAEWGEQRDDPQESQREVLREAHMRQCLREAQKTGAERIAVVCGAWHLRALQTSSVTVKADQALLKGLPKVKVQSTWVPWTYRHLTRSSGYGAGIVSPGWYEHLWRSQHLPQLRTVGWLARVARLMRERDLDCSSAHLIEATRLADALAAMRERPAAGLEELQEATRSVFAMGDDSLLHFIADELVVGDRLGSVPADVPTVPLQRDLEQAQKTLRLKPEAVQRTLDLDLRNSNDLARSHLLHRLRLLDVPWGELAKVGRSQGTFHEVWILQWQPEFLLQLIEASQWGQTLVQAATALVIDKVGRISDLAELAALVDQVLLADLDAAVPAVTQALQSRAALTGDVLQLLATLPPLANVFRYGNVRQTDAAMVAQVLDGLIVRTAIAMPLACRNVDDAAARNLREKLLAAHTAVALRQGQEETQAWRQALQQIASSTHTGQLLQGVAVRLLLDDAVWSVEQVAQAMSFELSMGAEPSKAAAWLEGFLNRNALVLLHDMRVWRLIDEWLVGLREEHFVRVLPLVRRTFSTFSASERSALAQRAGQGRGVAALPKPPAGWNEERAALPLPLLRQLLGVQQ